MRLIPKLVLGTFPRKGDERTCISEYPGESNANRNQIAYSKIREHSFQPSEKPNRGGSLAGWGQLSGRNTDRSPQTFKAVEGIFESPSLPRGKVAPRSDSVRAISVVSDLPRTFPRGCLRLPSFKSGSFRILMGALGQGRSPREFLAACAAVP